VLNTTVTGGVLHANSERRGAEVALEGVGASQSRGAQACQAPSAARRLLDARARRSRPPLLLQQGRRFIPPPAQPHSQPLPPLAPAPLSAAAATKVEGQGGKVMLIGIDHVLVPPSFNAKAPLPKDAKAAAKKKAADAESAAWAPRRAAAAALAAAPLLAAALAL
jgi:hypothetical protein